MDNYWNPKIIFIRTLKVAAVTVCFFIGVLLLLFGGYYVLYSRDIPYNPGHIRHVIGEIDSHKLSADSDGVYHLNWSESLWFRDGAVYSTTLPDGYNALLFQSFDWLSGTIRGYAVVRHWGDDEEDYAQYNLLPLRSAIENIEGPTFPSRRFAILEKLDPDTYRVEYSDNR